MATALHNCGTSDTEGKPTTGVDVTGELCGDLQCPVCLELFQQPLILPCSHVLCRTPCCSNLLHFNFIRCPVCRVDSFINGGLHSLPRVIVLENIIDKVRGQRSRLELKVQGSHPERPQQWEVTEAHTALVEHLGTDIEHFNSWVTGDEGRSDSGAASRQASGFFTSSTFSSTALVLDTLLTPRDEERTVLHHLSSEAGIFRGAHPVQTTCLPLPPASQGDLLTPRYLLYRDLFPATSDRLAVMAAAPQLSGSVNNLSSDLATLQVKLSNVLHLVSLGQEEVVTWARLQKECLKDLLKRAQHATCEAGQQVDDVFVDLQHELARRLTQLDDVSRALEILQGSSQTLVQDAMQPASYTMREGTSPPQGRGRPLSHGLHSVPVGRASPTRDLQLDGRTSRVTGCLTGVDAGGQQSPRSNTACLQAPALPALDVTRCARGEDKVALFLQPPTPWHDVIDTYEVTYFTEEEKTLGIQDAVARPAPTRSLTHFIVLFLHFSRLTLCLVSLSPPPVQQTLTFSNSAGQGSGARVMVLHKLRCGATYYFHLVARNTAGTSAPSDVVQCVTLAARHSVVPIPSINVSKCRASSSCIRVFTPSPHDVAPEQHISHWLLYRPRGPESVWQAAPLYGSQEQRVAGLDPETDYQLVVMARNARGECQLSHVLGIRTQPAHTP